MTPSPSIYATAVLCLTRAGFLVALVAAAAAGCGTNSPGKGCVPGQSIECAGTNACPGHQVCNTDGNAYGECICGDGGGETFPHVGPYSGLLGAACTSAQDCRHGLECVTSDSKLVHGEGPSSGMCLAQCLVEHDFCAAVDATAKCIVLDDGGTASTSDDLAYCLPGCKLGVQPGAADKCRGRSDLVCTEYPAGAGSGYCRPSCRSDIDCAPRSCDLSTGLCADSARSGDPIGAACNLNASQCAGGCTAQGSTYSECSGVCSFGTEGCGQKTDPPLDYFCAIGATTASGPGDLGYCAKLCNCDTDCGRTDAVCKPEADLLTKAGKHGFCAPKTTPSGSATPHLPCTP